MTDSTDPSSLADRPPGYDEADPYADEDVSEFPAWWRRNIEAFRENDLRAYRPPRFEDGEVVQTVVDDLESELGVPVELQVRNPQDGNDWEIAVDGDVVGTVARERHIEGYSLFHTTAGEFRDLVRESVEE